MLTSSQAQSYDRIYPRWDPRSRFIGYQAFLLVAAIKPHDQLSNRCRCQEDQRTHSLALSVCLAMIVYLFERKTDILIERLVFQLRWVFRIIL